MSDWIEWTGGSCPVDPDALTEVRVQDHVGYVDKPTMPASYWWWKWAYLSPQTGEIIAYRLQNPTSTGEGDGR